MTKLLKSPVVQLAFTGAVLACGWAGLEQINTNLGQLPVHQVEQVSDAAAMQLPEIFPVWVTPRHTKVELQPASEMETAFEKPPVVEAVEEEDAELAAPTYAETLKAAITVQGTTDTGVFLNGNFYRTGADASGLAFDGVDGQRVVPRVVAVSARKLVIAVAGERLTLTNEGGSWQ